MKTTVLCPGQGAQAVGMGRAWCEASPAARAVFERADRLLGSRLGRPLSALCFDGPADALNRTDISQPAIFVASVASAEGLRELGALGEIDAAAGLSLGEYTALHLAGAFPFETALEIVATRGRLMQESAEASRGGMVALVGADDAQAEAVCQAASQGQVLVCANFNAPGQIVVSGHAEACERAVAAAGAMGLRATPLTVAGAFHSPLMGPAAERMAEVLQAVEIGPLRAVVWSNVTAEPHQPTDTGPGVELLRRRLVEQIVSPVRWTGCCASIVRSGRTRADELAPGTVLKGLFRRIERSFEVTAHDKPDKPEKLESPSGSGARPEPAGRG